MPFDGQRMIWGGFAPINDTRQRGQAGLCRRLRDPRACGQQRCVSRDGATSTRRSSWNTARRATVDAWGDDVPDGKVTDYKGAVKAKKDETGRLLVGRMAQQGSARQRLEEGDGRSAHEGAKMPFDGKRMIYGGFRPILDA